MWFHQRFTYSLYSSLKNILTNKITNTTKLHSTQNCSQRGINVPQLKCLRSIKLSVVSPQAREDIISLLKSDKTRPETLEAHYGSFVPTKPLQALQRDNLFTVSNKSTEDVYEKPMAEVRPEENTAGCQLGLLTERLSGESRNKE